VSSLEEKIMQQVRITQATRITELNKAVFKVGDTVRIKSTLDINITGVSDLLGKKGTVVKVYCKGIIRNTIMYDVKIDDRIEPFEEHELDCRYVKRK
jgi:hypothetical protein